MEMGDLDRAEHTLHEATVRSPLEVGVWHASALLHDKRNDDEQTAKDYARALELDPSQSWRRKRRARVLFRLGQFREALEELTNALGWRGDDLSTLWWITPNEIAACRNTAFREGVLKLADSVVAQNPGSAPSRIARGMLLAECGESERARQDLNAVIAKGDAPCTALYEVALISLRLKDAPRYRAVCKQLFDRFARTGNSDDAHFTAWTLSLGPEAVADYTPVLALAERLRADRPKDPWAVDTLGALLFRAGRFTEAIKRLTEAEQLPPDQRTSPLYGWFLLAMAHHRLGHADEARRWLDQAETASDKLIADHDRGAEPLQPRRRMTLTLLRNEAKSLVGVKPPQREEKSSLLLNRCARRNELKQLSDEFRGHGRLRGEL